MWVQGVRQDAVYAVRTIRRTPGFAAAMIAVTALGISATTAVFGLIDGLVLAPLPVREPARLVWLKDPSFWYPVFAEVRARGSAIFDGFFAWNLDRLNVQWTSEPEPGEVLMASGDFYSTLGIRAVAGRTFDAADDRIGGGPRAWSRSSAIRAGSADSAETRPPSGAACVSTRRLSPSSA